MKYCKCCGEQIHEDCVICPKCGRQVEEIKQKEREQIIINNSASASAAASASAIGGAIGANLKDKTTSIILCCLGFFGLAGFHKFYEGKIVIGIIYLFTCGLCFIGTIIDLISLLGKPKSYYV